MEFTTQFPKAFRSNKPHPQAHYAAELVEITQRMREVEDRFNLCCDPDLTEACIYEMRALHARYSSVLKQARDEDLSAEV